MGVQGTWAGVMTVNFAIVDVDDTTSGYIGLVCTLSQLVMGLFVAQFTDHARRHIKITLIVMGLVSTLSFTWLLLIIIRMIPFQSWQLWTATVVGSSILPIIQPLIFEYTSEMAYPVTEGVIGGFMTGGYNLVSLII